MIKTTQFTLACGSQSVGSKPPVSMLFSEMKNLGPTHKTIEEQVATGKLSSCLPARIILSVLSNILLLELLMPLSASDGLRCIS